MPCGSYWGVAHVLNSNPPQPEPFVQLSKKSEYALRALLHMAKRPTQLVHTIQEISRAEKIPIKFLEQILLGLKKAGYLVSKRGLGGGYSLRRPLDQTPVLEIIALMEGTTLLPDAKSGGESDLAIRMFLRELSAEIVRLLGSHTIADLLQNARSLEGASFEI